MRQPLGHRARLIAERDATERLAAEALAAVEAANSVCRPYNEAWTRADRDLRTLLAQRADGVTVGPVTLFAAYDARMNAGHRRHPHKLRCEDAARWLAGLMTQLDRLEAALAEPDQELPFAPPP